MNYAPVIIPTLNRYEHFVNCLESLEKCTGHEHTIVYVALDYPPSPKYEEGWKKISSYLDKKEKDHSFKELIVVRRDHNYGICCENSNDMELIHNTIFKHYDRYIETEDDNIFSPNFLEYMNVCLDKFQNDDRVDVVCGYAHETIISESYHNNYVLTKNGSPWGIGKWRDKVLKHDKYYNVDYIKELIRKKDIRKIVFERNPIIVDAVVAMVKMGEVHGDGCMGLYHAIEDLFTVVPTVSKVRNYGNDGSGVHCPRPSDKDQYFRSRPIDEDTHFEMTNDVFVTDDHYISVIPKKNRITLRRIIRQLRVWFDRYCFIWFGVVPKNKYL